MKGIYAIRNTCTNKCYIGSSNNLSRRERDHWAALSSNKHFNEYLQNSWNKYGANNFKFEILELVDIEEKLKELEDFYINKFSTTDRAKGYNLTTADRSLRTPESIAKQQISRGDKYKGVNAPMYGKKHSEETKRKISKFQKSFKKSPMTDETKQKIGKRTKGKTYEDLYGEEKALEIKQKQSKMASQRRGEKSPMFGRKASEETKAKMSKSQIGKHNNLSAEGKESIRQSKIGSNNPNYINISPTIQNMIVQNYLSCGFVTNQIVEATGVSRYKIKAYLKELGIYNERC